MLCLPLVQLPVGLKPPLALALSTLLVATVGEVLDLLLVRGVIPFRQAQNSPRMLQGGIIASVAFSRSSA